MKQLPVYILIILVIGLLVFKCDNKPVESNEVVIHKTDTLVVEVPVIHKDIQVKKIIETKTDTFIKEGAYPVKEFHYDIKDSLLNGKIVVKSPFYPEVDFNYTVKSHTIKDSIVLKQTDYRGFLYGGEIVIQPLLSQMFAGVAYQNKRGDLIDLSVGRDFINNNNIVKIGFKKRF